MARNRAIDMLRHEDAPRQKIEALAMTVDGGSRLGAAARATMGDDALAALGLRAGQLEVAAGYDRDALQRPCSEPERRFLRRRLATCEDAARHPTVPSELAPYLL